MTQKGVIADRPGFRGSAGRRCGEQRLHDVVIGIRLVGEAAAVLLRTMISPGLARSTRCGKRPMGAVAVRHQRYRRPGAGIGEVLAHLTAGSLTEANAVAGIARRRRGPMFGTGRRMRKHRGLARDVMRKAAGRQNDAASRSDLCRLVMHQHRRADNADRNRPAGPAPAPPSGSVRPVHRRISASGPLAHCH